MGTKIGGSPRKKKKKLIESSPFSIPPRFSILDRPHRGKKSDSLGYFLPLRVEEEEEKFVGGNGFPPISFLEMGDGGYIYVGKGCVGTHTLAVARLIGRHLPPLKSSGNGGTLYTSSRKDYRERGGKILERLG